MSDTMTPTDRLARAGIELPDALPPFGQYVPTVLHGATLWVGGHFGTGPDGSILTGTCGRDVTADDARVAARSAAVNLLATVQDAIGSLDRVQQVVQVYGVVNATPDFVEHTRVIDAASDVFVQVFGDAGRHSRLAVGVSSLPAGLVLEIQATIVVSP